LFAKVSVKNTTHNLGYADEQNCMPFLQKAGTCFSWSLAWHLQAKKAQMVAKRDEDEWGTGDLGEELLPQ